MNKEKEEEVGSFWIRNQSSNSYYYRGLKGVGGSQYLLLELEEEEEWIPKVNWL